jgi:quercetin dioxygenase-like cupin family protein
VNTGRVERWDEIPLERVTEMVSRKVFVGDRQVMVQVHLLRGTHVPVHRHEGEQMIYVLQGALRCSVGGREVTVKEGDVLHLPAGVRHQAEALEDTFQIVVFGDGSPTPPVGSN